MINPNIYGDANIPLAVIPGHPNSQSSVINSLLAHDLLHQNSTTWELRMDAIGGLFGRRHSHIIEKASELAFPLTEEDRKRIKEMCSEVS